MPITPLAYEDGNLNREIFARRDDIRLSQFHKSVSHFFTSSYIKEGYSFLDIGGAGGDLCQAIIKDVCNIKPTILDPDVQCIESRKNDPSFASFKFVKDYYPSEGMKNEKFDIVSMQALFPQIPEWKKCLLDMANNAKKFLNFSVVLKTSGNTIVDKDVSYFYYLDSGVRVHQVIHNLYEITNFLSLREMRAKTISFYGYHTPVAGDNFRCVPNSQQIKGNFMIELFSEQENPKRVGGAVDLKNANYQFFAPKLDYIIDGKEFLFD